MKAMNERKLETLKAMHNIVCLMNDEDAYGSWINLIPDQATNDDLAEIANDEDDSIYNDAVVLFMRLCSNYGKDGLFFQNYPNSKLYGVVKK